MDERLKNVNLIDELDFTFSDVEQQLINDEKLLSKNKFKIELNDINKYYIKNENLLIHGGRERALDILKSIKNGEFINYDKYRAVIILLSISINNNQV